MLLWIIRSVGYLYGPLLLVSGLGVFIGACIVIGYRRRGRATAAYLSIVPLPVVIGVIGTLHGTTQCFVNVHDGDPVDMDILVGLTSCLATTWVGLLFALPTYLMISITWILRAIAEERSTPGLPALEIEKEAHFESTDER